jgi:Glucose / Sorbosone dehydrogenase
MKRKRSLTRACVSSAVIGLFLACEGPTSAPEPQPAPVPASSAPLPRPSTPPAGSTDPAPGGAGGSPGVPGADARPPQPEPGSTGGMGMGGSTGGTGGTAGSPAATSPDAGLPTPPDASSAPVRSCNATPGPGAAMLKLAFRPVELVNLPGNPGSGKSPGGLTELRFMPGAPNDFMISQKAGRLHHFRLAGNRATLVASYTVPGVFAADDCGFVSFAYDPGFAQNRIIYAAHCSAANRSKVARFTLSPTGLTGAADVITFSEPDSTNPWHSVGSVGFDPGGNMWLMHGEFTDGSNAQNPASNLGKLLRLRPRRDRPGFDPAPGNAFPDGAGGSPLVYALGFRSPWRAYLDSKGRFLVGDVGNTTNEELNIVTAVGQNFGWNGSRSGPCTGGGCAGLINPLVTYRNGGSDPYLSEGLGDEGFDARAGRAIWVGGQYQDCGNDRYGDALTGVYLFGDWYTGWVRGAVIDDNGKMTRDQHLANFPGLSAWAQADDGYAYMLSFGNYGTGGNADTQPGLFRLEPAP